LEPTPFRSSTLKETTKKRTNQRKAESEIKEKRERNDEKEWERTGDKTREGPDARMMMRNSSIRHEDLR
jgi:hypothetical protein